MIIRCVKKDDLALMVHCGYRQVHASACTKPAFSSVYAFLHKTRQNLFLQLYSGIASYLATARASEIQNRHVLDVIRYIFCPRLSLDVSYRWRRSPIPRPSAILQPKLQGHEHRTNALRGVPVYRLAYAGTVPNYTACLVKDVITG